MHPQSILIPAALVATVVVLISCGSTSRVQVDAGADGAAFDVSHDLAEENDLAVEDGPAQLPDVPDADDILPAPTPLKLTFTSQGGFDDFSSPGAALGWAVDEEKGTILIVALKFDLPLATKEFQISPDVAATLLGYTVKPDAEFLQQDVGVWPLLQAGITDTIGVRTMAFDATVILLEGDLADPTPARIFVADSGTVSLFRKDGPSDIVEGSATVVEVTGLGQEGQVKPGGEVFSISPFYFEW